MKLDLIQSIFVVSSEQLVSAKYLLIDLFFFFLRLEEVTAQANELSRSLEHKEEQIRSLKTRLEEAVHQNNKMTNAAELKDDKIKTLEQRFVFFHSS